MLKQTKPSTETEEFRLNLRDTRLRTDPHQYFAELRARGDVVPGRMTVMGRLWLITGYEAVSQCLRDTDRFVRNPKNAGRKRYASIQMVMPRMFNRLAKNMLGSDKEDHRRQRMLVEKAFTRQNIQTLEQRIAEIADRLIEQATSEARGESIDLIPAYARPLPLIVICELLGLPDSDRPKFMKWFERFSSVNSLLGIVSMLPNLRRTMKYLEGQFREVANNPRPGLITDLVQVEAEGDRLSHEELLSMAMLLLLAGHETTVHLISTSIYTLFQMPDVRARLQSDWSLLDSCIDEMLRYNSPVQMTKPRFVAEDCEFHGQTLKRGEMVVAMLASANYDPRVFDQPDRFIIDRQPNRHLTFGAGPHVCLGLKLAKAETAIAIHRLLGKYPDMQPAFDVANPVWSKRIGMRALKELPVRAE